MTIEEFVVLAHFLMMNIGKGETEISSELIFEDYQMEETSPLSHKSDIGIKLPQGLENAFERASVHTGDIGSLARGFFLLKKNIVDYDRLNDAITGVSENLDRYLSGLSTISIDGLADAYRIGTTRNNSQKRLGKILEDFSDLAGELEKLEQQVDIEELQKKTDRYRRFHHLSHTQEDLAELYDEIEGTLGPLNVTHRQQWRDIGQLLNDSENDLGLGDFRSTLNEIEETEADDALSSIALLHEYQRSQNESAAWKVYEVFAEMIEELEDAEGSEVGDFRSQVESSNEFEEFRSARDSAQQTIGGTQ